ncbi:MAG: box helicase, partial [Frankiales bacterium]|nr:box helicase [Frankiales bacterium]
MPNFNKSTPPKRGGGFTPNGKAAGHRGQRPAEGAAPKQRWSADDRARRTSAPPAGGDRKPFRGRDAEGARVETDRRPNWTPRDKPAYQPRGERPSNGERPARPSYGDRPARPAYGDRTERPSYNNDRPARTERPSYGDRPARPAYGDRT